LQRLEGLSGDFFMDTPVGEAWTMVIVGGADAVQPDTAR